MLRPPYVMVQGRILDASPGGIKLKMPQAVEPGTLLQIRSRNRFVLAEVRYCLLQADDYHVGVEVKDVFWPDVYFLPR